MKIVLIIPIFVIGMIILGFLMDKGIVPEWIIVIVMIGFSFGMVYFTFLRGILKNRRLLKHGLPAEATVIKRFDTGTTVNNNPQIGLVLDVDPGTDVRFQAEARVLVSRLNPDAFPVGSKVKVRYDPKNKKNVAVESEDTGFARETAQKMVDEIVEEYKDLQRIGKSARATITRTWDMNINITDESGGQGRLTGLLVEVEPLSGPKFEAEIKASIAHKSLDKYIPGTRLLVFYDPKDLRRVCIDRREGVVETN